MLTIYGITCPTGFSADWAGAIPAGGSQAVNVRFSPTTVSSYAGEVLVNCDATSGSNSIPVSGFGKVTPIAASYNGLFYDNQTAYDSSGSFTAKTSLKAAFSAKVSMRGKSFSFAGKLGPDGRSTNLVNRGPLGPLSVELALDLSGSERLLGRVTDGNWSAELIADKAVFDKTTSPTPFKGSYTIRIPGSSGTSESPQGDGFGSVVVDSGGKVYLKGTLSDGTKVTHSAVLSKFNQWPLYISLYNGRGLTVGWLTFTNDGNQGIFGEMRWIKSSGSASQFYPAGFQTDTLVTGSFYSSPPTGSRILNFSAANVSFFGGNLSQDFTKTVTLGSDNKMVGEGFSISFTLATGLFKGRVIDPTTGKFVSFQGAVSKEENIGFGFFLGSSQSGRVYLGL